jgi:hypothetical protein
MYYVKLFFAGGWRAVAIDDRCPVNKHGSPLITTSACTRELWPLLLAKAVYKLFTLAGYASRCFNGTSPASEAWERETSFTTLTISMLTGWITVPHTLPFTTFQPVIVSESENASTLPEHVQALFTLAADTPFVGSRQVPSKHAIHQGSLTHRAMKTKRARVRERQRQQIEQLHYVQTVKNREESINTLNELVERPRRTGVLLCFRERAVEQMSDRVQESVFDTRFRYEHGIWQHPPGYAACRVLPVLALCVDDEKPHIEASGIQFLVKWVVGSAEAASSTEAASTESPGAPRTDDARTRCLT